MNSARRHPSKAPGSGSGFTLLEILVAIFIFALVITTVFGSFRAVFSSADAVGGDVAIFESARTCLGRMATDLEALYASQYPRYAKPEFNDPQDPYRLVGDATDVTGISFGRLQFASLAHLSFNLDPRQGVCRIVYYVHQRSDESLVLRRADHLFPFPDFQESEDDPILCDNILALEFGYMGAEGEMSDQWDSESADTDYATPRSIEIRLTVGTPSRPKEFTTRVSLHVYRKAAE
ncbi:MAG: prepilin-type N-terminal cleavage/methylation domain-containing protein [Desulfosarcina sp.]|nr:prepilin-type N-terminal cleavage/methylation domain-containing protein [Desulfosarcina sp.]MBC2741500.1 prepilin-type N-terminal cleavage/methylation domain-containing protein [Desulfosarcina sp.]MBC2764414.1 prepilin-type N-terminal cleavage/methylation domain-containing protein [Desulfosarcina sp.]